MDREEFIAQLQSEIRARFQELSEEEQDTLRQIKGTAFAAVLRKVFGAELLAGLQVADPRNIPTPRRGLGTR
jgi:hypothetical protein